MTNPTTPPTSPVPTAGPTKEAMHVAACIRTALNKPLYIEAHLDHVAIAIDQGLNLTELLAIQEAAERALKSYYRGDNLKEMEQLGQSLTAYAQAAGKAETK